MDFGVDAERHFFGTKGPCDREFGTLTKAVSDRVKTRRARLAWKIFCLNISHKSVLMLSQMYCLAIFKYSQVMQMVMLSSYDGGEAANAGRHANSSHRKSFSDIFFYFRCR